MRKELKEFVNNYINGVKEAVEAEFENNSYYVFDYLNEIEDSLKYNDIKVNNNELTEVQEAVKKEIIKIYGDENCYYDAIEHMIPINGIIKTVYAQMVIVKA